MMQLADALRAEETPYTLVFVAFGAEEAGLKGSKAYFDGMTAAQKAAVVLTNPGLNKDYPYGTTGDWSDHAVFSKSGIPYLYVEATNWQLGDKDGSVNSAKYGEIWHSKKDTISYIEQQLPRPHGGAAPSGVRGAGGVPHDILQVM